VLVVGGRDRLRFLHAVTAADVATLAPGAGVYGALTDDRGGPIADFHLFVLPEVVLLELPAGRADEARAALDRLVIADDVTTAWAGGATVAYEAGDPERLVAALASERAGRFAPPPDALADLAPGAGFAAGAAADGPGPDAADEAALAAVPRRLGAVLRASRLGGYGALHWAADGDRAGELARAAARPGVRIALSATERDPLEIEAGRIGAAELAEAKVWNELAAMHAVSLTKGCWMGQEIVRRVHAQGAIQRRLGGVELDAPHGAGWAGARLTAADGADAGVITRAARSAAAGRTVGLAFLRRGAWPAGTPLVAVRADGARAAARSADLPFVRRVPAGAGTPAFAPGEAS
jgi:folate-binding protein YgfZ